MLHLLSKPHLKKPSGGRELNKEGKRVCMKSFTKTLKTMPNSQGIDRVFLGPRYGQVDQVTKQLKYSLTISLHIHSPPFFSDASIVLRKIDLE